MKQDLNDKRLDYSKNKIEFSSVPENPMLMFKDWYNDACSENLIREAYAMNLSTIGEDGFPRTRVVLLKEFNQEGFVFFTNYLSFKGNAIASNQKVCLSFYWDQLERQVIIKGVAEKLSVEDSTEYFHKRPFESQLGALVSAQSSAIDFDRKLEEEVEELTKVWAGKQVPKPDYWGGFLVKPTEVEFWQGRPSRLHDRLLYRFENESWTKERLAP